MKKSVIEFILGMVIMVCLILATCEAENPDVQLVWSGCWLLVCVIAVKLLENTYTKEDWEEKA